MQQVHHGRREELRVCVDRLLAQAAGDGAALVLLFSDTSDEQQLAGFGVGPMTDGLTNAQLRPLVASLLGTAYTTRQMGYDLRRLARKGVIKRLDRQKRYVLTPYGRRVALFLTKVHARVIRPGLQTLDLSFTAQAPPRLRTTFTALDRAIGAHIAEAQLAA